MARRKKYIRPKKFGSWLSIKGDTKHYKTLRGLINRAFKSEGNYVKLYTRLQKYSPGQFKSTNNVIGSLYNVGFEDKKTVLEFVHARAKAIYQDMLRKNPKAKIEDALRSTLNSRVFTSANDIAVTNFQSFLRKRDDETREFKNRLREKLGVKKIDFSKFKYSNNISYDDIDEFGRDVYETQQKGYIYEGTNVAVTVQGSGSASSPYHFDLHVNESTSV